MDNLMRCSINCKKTNCDNNKCNKVSVNNSINNDNYYIKTVQLYNNKIDKNEIDKTRFVSLFSSTVSNIRFLKKGQRSDPYNGAYLDHFIDYEFPPAPTSISSNSGIFKLSGAFYVDGLKNASNWLRPNQIKFKPEDEQYPLTLISNPSPRDVLQGNLGSCWFISALSVIANRPDILYNILLTQYYNPYGLHQIRLCVRGQWIVVNIDDYLPCDSTGKIVFAYAKYRQLWVSFIEKALAKIYGNYEAIVSGACVEGLQTITGEPCEVLYLENANKNYNNPNYLLSNYKTDDDNPYYLWQKLLYAQSAGYLMTTLCYDDKKKLTDFQRKGLFNRHIYSILDVREFYHNGQTINLLKLRNPWGKKEWKGAWSNTWSHWPQEILQEISTIYKKNDGTFWISYEDVLKYFYDITVCKVRANWFESRKSSYFYDYYYGTEVFTLAVFEQGEFEVELFSTGRKYFGFDRNADPEIDLCIVICSIADPSTGTGLTCVAFEHNVEYFTNLTAKLEPGYYIIFVTSIRAALNIAYEDQSDPNYYSYNLAVHGSSNFTLNEYVYPSEMVADIFNSVAVFKNKSKLELSNNLRSSTIQGPCTHAIMVENLSMYYTIKVTLDISQSQNIDSTRMEAVTVDYIAPGSRQIIAYLTPSDYRKGFTIKYKIESQLLENSITDNQPPVPYSYYGLHAVRSIYTY